MITITPTVSRYVQIEHHAWDAAWQIQFPESIGHRDGWLMDFPPIYPDWRTDAAGTLHYTWRSDADYVRVQEHNQGVANDGVAEVKRFQAGAELNASLTVLEHGVGLRLALTNNTGQQLQQVICDGGCFQAKSVQFAAPGEVSRTYISSDGQLHPLSTLPRSNAVRCVYHVNLAEYDLAPDKGGEWFWGRSTATVSAPVIMAMQSVDGRRAVAIGYDRAQSGAANADDHHCIHSRPFFGDMLPGETQTTRGAIAFGASVAEAAALVRAYIALRQ